ncbi:PREDICTED: receptor expression-enhancing protein 2 isoform X8 [Bactrocera latifrons]|nr:PREDICTED: receptor expression-enhancing protein 2 isoform X8 [Bactrocera latifrons]
MISALLSRFIILSFGTLYPAYASYKAVRTKNVKEYVKWMMYWIVYAFFTCIETFTDIFLSWFPFYYEVKVIIVLWLLSPATKGSSTLYRKFVHPMLTRREQEIDEYLNQAKERGYSAVLQLGTKGVNYATNVIMQTALKTVQFGMGTIGNNQFPAQLSTSHSDNEIDRYRRNAQSERDDPDCVAGDATWMQRSASLGQLNAAQLEFSEDDEQLDLLPLMRQEQQMFDEEELAVVGSREKGAARSRELPTRKARTRKTSTTTITTATTRDSKQSKATAAKATGAGIRGRRKLRDATPDMDIDIE